MFVSLWFFCSFKLKRVIPRNGLIARFPHYSPNRASRFRSCCCLQLLNVLARYRHLAYLFSVIVCVMCGRFLSCRHHRCPLKTAFAKGLTLYMVLMVTVIISTERWKGGGWVLSVWATVLHVEEEQVLTVKVENSDKHSAIIMLPIGAFCMNEGFVRQSCPGVATGTQKRCGLFTIKRGPGWGTSGCFTVQFSKIMANWRLMNLIFCQQDS